MFGKIRNLIELNECVYWRFFIIMEAFLVSCQEWCIQLTIVEFDYERVIHLC